MLSSRKSQVLGHFVSISSMNEMNMAYITHKIHMGHYSLGYLTGDTLSQ